MIINYNNILKQFSNIRFYKLEYLGDISPCFYAPSRYLNNEVTLKQLLTRFMTLRKMNYTYKVSNYGKRQVIFLFSANYMGRDDYKKAFDNVTSLIKDKIILTPVREQYKIKSMSMGLILIWFFQLRKVNLSWKNKMQYLFELFFSYKNYQTIKSIIDNNKGLKLLLTYTDVHSIDSLVTIYANTKKIPTATLQHGMLNTNPKIIGKDMDSAGTITMSRSKYLLVYGPLISSYARTLKVKREKIISVGNALNIYDRNVIKMSRLKKGIFAIILDGIVSKDFEFKNNQKLIEFGEYVAKRYNVTFIVRKHPSDKNNYRFTSSYLERYSNRRESISQLSEKIDFAIMGYSTVFSELVYFMVPAFRYIYTDYNPYYGVKWNEFRNSTQLLRLIDLYLTDWDYCQSQMKSTRDCFFEVGSSKEHFLKFFNRFLKDNEF